MEKQSYRGERRRGRRPTVSDRELLRLILDDLRRSPFRAEGHRKVFARLHHARGIPVSRKRICRIMREHALCQPRCLPGAASAAGKEIPHTRHIITTKPNITWATDGAKVETLRSGVVTVFVVVEHWNAECLGWCVSRRETLRAALRPVEAAIGSVFHSVEQGVAEGLHLRLDHWEIYLSPAFLQQIRWWGIEAHFAYPMQPQTNGVAERFIRTLREQVFYEGRVFAGIPAISRAMKRFAGLYNAQWRIEKLRYRSPLEARRRYNISPSYT